MFHSGSSPWPFQLEQLPAGWWASKCYGSHRGCPLLQCLCSSIMNRGWCSGKTLLGLEHLSFALPAHCVELPDTGQCTESIPRWYYNPFSEKCDRFTYGGCDGNMNNFEEEEECMKSCSGVTSKQEQWGLEYWSESLQIKFYGDKEAVPWSLQTKQLCSQILTMPHNVLQCIDCLRGTVHVYSMFAVQPVICQSWKNSVDANV